MFKEPWDWDDWFGVALFALVGTLVFVAFVGPQAFGMLVPVALWIVVRSLYDGLWTLGGVYTRVRSLRHRRSER